MYLNAWDADYALRRAPISHPSKQHPISAAHGGHGDLKPAQARLPDGVGYAEAARTQREDTRRRRLANFGTSADSMLHRPMPEVGRSLPATPEYGS
jgi:hypothetical protein